MLSEREEKASAREKVSVIQLGFVLSICCYICLVKSPGRDVYLGKIDDIIKYVPLIFYVLKFFI